MVHRNSTAVAGVLANPVREPLERLRGHSNRPTDTVKDEANGFGPVMTHDAALLRLHRVAAPRVSGNAGRAGVRNEIEAASRERRQVLENSLPPAAEYAIPSPPTPLPAAGRGEQGARGDGRMLRPHDGCGR